MRPRWSTVRSMWAPAGTRDRPPCDAAREDAVSIAPPRARAGESRLPGQARAPGACASWAVCPIRRDAHPAVLRPTAGALHGRAHPCTRVGTVRRLAKRRHRRHGGGGQHDMARDGRNASLRTPARSRACRARPHGTAVSDAVAHRKRGRMPHAPVRAMGGGRCRNSRRPASRGMPRRSYPRKLWITRWYVLRAARSAGTGARNGLDSAAAFRDLGAGSLACTRSRQRVALCARSTGCPAMSTPADTKRGRAQRTPMRSKPMSTSSRCSREAERAALLARHTHVVPLATTDAPQAWAGGDGAPVQVGAIDGLHDMDQMLSRKADRFVTSRQRVRGHHRRI